MAAISVIEFEPDQEAESGAEENLLGIDELLKTLADDGYDQPDYARLKMGPSSTAKSAPLDAKALGKLNALPLSYAEIRASRGKLETLSKEAGQFQNPAKMPDISRMNYMTQLGDIIRAFADYGTEKIQKTMRGKNRTLDVVMEETLEVIEDLQEHVAQALAHSAAVINGITIYQEKILECRIVSATGEWSDAKEGLEYAQGLLRSVAACKETCTPNQYSALATSGRNLVREIQHLRGVMNETEATTVYSSNTMATMNSLEGNLRTGMIGLNYLSGLVAQAIETAKYEAQGSMLLRDGYANADILTKTTESMTRVLHYHDTAIDRSIVAFNESLEKAGTETAPPRQLESKAKVMEIGYNTVRARADKIFRERGLYRPGDAAGKLK